MARHWLTYYYMSDDEFKAEHAERDSSEGQCTQRTSRHEASQPGAA